MKKLFLFLVTFLWIEQSHALTTEETYSIEDIRGEQTKTIEDYIEDFVDVPEGGINWKVFGTTQEIHIETKDADGFDLAYTKPEFAPEVKALDGQQIKIKGYMFPLDETEEQKLFLFGPFPLSCPFQYHVGPALVLEVHADKNPVTFDYEAITITGTLELVPDDPEYSVFYRLNNAKQVK